MSDTRLVDAFWLSWEGRTPGITARGTWDMSRDANQRQMLLKAQARGATRFQLFSNSPVWWMTDDHNPSGSRFGFTDNLQAWNRRNHSVYLAEVAAHARAHWGVAFEDVEPFNEPIAHWWTARGTQEGCHFDRATQATVLLALREELDARGLSATHVAASDENTYDEAIDTWKAIGTAAQRTVDKINVHGYQQGGGRRDVLYATHLPHAYTPMCRS